jgi:hypothetical protein
MRDSHQGITSGIHPWNGRSPQGVRDDSSHGIHLAAEFFAKRRSLKQLGGDKTAATRALSLRGKHHLLKLPLLSKKGSHPIFHHLNPFLAQQVVLFFCEDLMAIRTDKQVVTPIPDDFDEVERVWLL